MPKKTGDAPAAKKPTDAPAPNLKFIGKETDTGKLDATGQPVMIQPEPLTKINNGEQVIILPPVEAQRAEPFFHRDAPVIVRLYPALYKMHVVKGEK